MRVTALNSSAVDVQWQAPELSERNGIIRGYQVYYQRSVDGQLIGQERMRDFADGNQTQGTIGNLQPETTYSFTLSAYTRKGDGTRSRARTATTKGASKL